MTDAPLSRALLDLLARSLASMEQVEALLVLSRTPERSLRADEVAREQRVESGAARAALDALAAHGLVVLENGAYRFAPRDPATADAVAELAVAYETRPVTLIKALYSRPAPSAAQAFADAFVLRKPGAGGH